MTEEQRAALWRAQVSRRVAFQAQLWTSLAGDPAATEELYAAWWPLIEYLSESQMPTVDPEDDPEFDPMGISDTVNVGT